MPSSQSEYPVTLAEVLFDELEHSLEQTLNLLDELAKESGADSSNEIAELIEKYRAIKNQDDWIGVEDRIEEIKDLPTKGRKEIVAICDREKLEVDKSNGDVSDDDVWKLKRALSNKLIPELYRIGRSLPTRRSALCLSGGGVRSAIFNLGILQGLARCRLLDKFDYLSTVSGGGFIGGWLTAWIYREEVAAGKLPVTAVAASLADPPTDPLKPEPPPLHKLRVYANYLTPRKGLLGVDTWTLVAVYLRNLFLNWLVFVPVIMALLMIPRMWLAFVRGPHTRKPFAFNLSEPLLSFLNPTALWIIGGIAAAVALFYIAMNLPASKKWNFRERRFVIFCLTPLVISAMALAKYWAILQADEAPKHWQFIVFAVALASAQWIPYVYLRIRGRQSERRNDDDERFRRSPAWRFALSLAIATVLIAGAFAITGFVTWYIVVHYLTPPLNLHVLYGRIYASVAVPLLLILLTVGGTLIAGFTSRFTNVDDQEWWARAGAWILIVAICWSAFHLLVLFGPSVFVDLLAQIWPPANGGPAQEPHSFADCCAFLVSQKTWSWSGLKGIATAVAGVVSGAITLFGGYSSKTPAQGGEEKDTGWMSWLSSIMIPLAAVLFGVFLVIIFALITNLILASSFGKWLSEILRAGAVTLNASDPRSLIYQSPGRLLVLIAVILAVAGWIFGRVINTNKFSLHYYWRNRMMRAYLGVSRHAEQREETRNKFTDFDLADDLQMYEVRQKPLHVVNVALNLAGGNKLEWQDRKAESFSISPLHSGSYWLGYRSSRYYGAEEGISLATAVAISGAAASPNMGYMMTSAVIRFIMALFNVRLGFWLGNPGVAGSGDPSTFNQTTYDRDSPTQSVRPIFAEALGLTNDQSPYVYLSDGGHFDNFGLYEMILRRCRFIVVSDASTDPDYVYESLAYAIRQVRVDFGVPIEFRKELQFGKTPSKENRYCAIADIRYSCVDNPGGAQDPRHDGVLIYLKPSLNGSEPEDVLNYHRADDAFPEDTIVDQWFSEPQFESYRMLGSHMLRTICPEPLSGADYFERFEELAKRHLRL